MKLAIVERDTKSVRWTGGRATTARSLSPSLGWLGLGLVMALGSSTSGCGQSSDAPAAAIDASAGGSLGQLDGSATASTGGQGVPGETGGASGPAGSGGSSDGSVGGAGGVPATSAGGSAGGGGGGGFAGTDLGGRGGPATGGSAAGGRAGAAGISGSGGAGGGGTANITIWLAGDSTMASGVNPCPIGWGKSFQSHFNSHVKVTNDAVAGTTIRSWLYDVSSTLGADGQCVLNSPNFKPGWTGIMNGMKAGDYLFIQFGINDTATGACPKRVSTALFGSYFGMMAQVAKARGANPVFVTSVSSIACSGSNAIPTRDASGFAPETRAAGLQYGVPVIDLEQLSVALYTSLGFCPLPGADVPATYASGAIGNFFCTDHTHFEAAGAAQIADLVAKAIRDQGLGLASYLTP